MLFFSRFSWLVASFVVVAPALYLFTALGLPVGPALVLGVVAAAVVIGGLERLLPVEKRTELPLMASFVGVVAGIWLTVEAFSAWGPRPLTFAVPAALLVLLIAMGLLLAGEIQGPFPILPALGGPLALVVAVLAAFDLGHPFGPLLLVTVAALALISGVVLGGRRRTRQQSRGPVAENLVFCGGLSLPVLASFLLAPYAAGLLGWNLLLTWLLTLVALALVWVVPLALLMRDPSGEAAVRATA